jgi:hypothetical protein
MTSIMTPMKPSRLPMMEMKPSPLPVGDVGSSVKPAYVPPSRRSTSAPAPPQLPENVDLDNASAFPTLVSAATPKKAWASASGSFTQKIHEWIAFDRMTAVERARAEERARELEGWETLPIKKMPDLGIEFNTNLLMAEHFAKSIDSLNELGLHFQKHKSIYRSYDDEPCPAIHEEPTPPSFIEEPMTDDEEDDNN